MTSAASRRRAVLRACGGLLFFVSIAAQPHGADVALTVDPRHILNPIDEKIYGASLSQAAGSDSSGGLWAEQVRNRSFEWPPLQNSRAMIETARDWFAYGDGATSRSAYHPLNSAYALEINTPGPETGVRQSHWQIKPGAVYEGSLWVRGEAPGGLIVRLMDGDTTLAAQRLAPPEDDWLEFPLHLAAVSKSPTIGNGALEIGVLGAGHIWLDQVSLMDEAARAAGGFRPDLLAAVQALHPTLLRWPGNGDAEHYDWKHGVGPQAERPADSATPASAATSNAFGTDEFMDLCQRLGTQPLLVVNTGFAQGARTPAAWAPFVRSAAEWMGYCEGPLDSTWGAMRGQDGHRAPYETRLWEADPLATNPNDPLATPSIVEPCFQTFSAAMKKLDPRLDVLSIAMWEARLTQWLGGLSAGAKWIAQESGTENSKIDNSTLALPLLAERSDSAKSQGALIQFDDAGWFPSAPYVVMKFWRDRFAPNRIALDGDTRSLKADATLSADGHVAFVKIINPADLEITLTLTMAGTAKIASVSGEVIAPGPWDTWNTMAHPDIIHVAPLPVERTGAVLNATLPRKSATVVSIRFL